MAFPDCQWCLNTHVRPSDRFAPMTARVPGECIVIISTGLENRRSKHIKTRPSVWNVFKTRSAFAGIFVTALQNFSPVAALCNVFITLNLTIANSARGRVLTFLPHARISCRPRHFQSLGEKWTPPAAGKKQTSISAWTQRNVNNADMYLRVLNFTLYRPNSKPEKNRRLWRPIWKARAPVFGNWTSKNTWNAQSQDALHCFFLNKCFTRVPKCVNWSKAHDRL